MIGGNGGTTQAMRKVVARAVLGALAAAVLPVPRASAQGNDPAAQRAAEAIEKALKRHAPEVHRCFETALADRLDVAGDVEVEVDVGSGGRVVAAKVQPRGGGEAPAALAACVEARAKTFVLNGIEAGASVVLPFSFTGQVDQFAIKVADVPDRGPRPPGKSAKAAAPPFSVKILVDPVNVRLPRAALTLLTVAPKSRVALHRHPGASKALYLLSGRARFLAPGNAPVAVEPGTAIFVPSGYTHAIESVGAKEPAMFLQAFSPPGPERIYREPGDAEARAAFEVVRDPSKVAKASTTLAPVVTRANATPELRALGAKAHAKILLEQKATSSADLSVSVVEFAPGAQWPRHAHNPASEILYVISGAGTLEVGSEKTPFGPATALYLPAGQPHAFKFAATGPTRVVQIFAPAGPEQEFHAGAARPANEAKKEEASKVIR